jgi:hypothetical protein
MGEGNENLVHPFSWDLKRSFTCRKILRHGTSGFTSNPKEGLLRIFIALKIHRLRRVRTRVFGSTGKHTNHYDLFTHIPINSIVHHASTQILFYPSIDHSEYIALYIQLYILECCINVKMYPAGM